MLSTPSDAKFGNLLTLDSGSRILTKRSKLYDQMVRI